MVLTAQMNGVTMNDYLPAGTRITQTWPAAEGWRCVTLVTEPDSDWEVSPILAWALLETPQGQRLTSLSVRVSAIEIESPVTFVGYLQPFESPDNDRLLALVSQAARRRRDSHLASRSSDPQASLTAEQFCSWAFDFTSTLSGLNWPRRLQGKLADKISRLAQPEDGLERLDDVFVAQRMRTADHYYAVSGLYSFDDWCQRLATIGDSCIPHYYFKKQQRTDLIAHAKAYLESLSRSSE